MWLRARGAPYPAFMSWRSCRAGSLRILCIRAERTNKERSRAAVRSAKYAWPLAVKTTSIRLWELSSSGQRCPRELPISQPSSGRPTPLMLNPIEGAKAPLIPSPRTSGSPNTRVTRKHETRD